MNRRGLLSELEAELGEEVVGTSPVGGGSINEAVRVDLAGGAALFVKFRPGAPLVEFEAEATGLRWLGAADAVAVPAVRAVGAESAWLALEWIEPGGGLDEPSLGRGLATLHRAGAERHGQLPPGSPDETLRLGSLELPSAPAESWPRLYAEERLMPLLRMARERGAIGSADAARIEQVCERIESLAGPSEPPARLHGDLWSGNVIAGRGGRPWLIDPAAHGGHREVDLAMLRLFGSPSRRLFDAYEEAYPLAEGHEERVALWQLLPLLAHAVLFGGGYGASAGRAAARYA